MLTTRPSFHRRDVFIQRLHDEKFAIFHEEDTATALRASTVPGLTAGMTARIRALKSKYALDAWDAGAGTPLTTALVRTALGRRVTSPPPRTATPTGRRISNRNLFASFPPIAGSTPRTLNTKNSTSATAAPLAKKPNSGAKAFALPTLGLTAATPKRAPSRR